ncbi:MULTISPECIES: TolC family protein [Diaphorobacter]|uniref:Outer membrane efflux protein n=1 Tax=Acidovorax ebreus (strain TPSY) TaxID=535289 RepID=A0A9J9QCR5_ACIET|nr:MULTISPECIES: TolC family protein [Diaphorobacter]ACM33648.1 outer membrane efflux protein [[Acidovorax] ebreus TPSY]
MQSRLRGYCVPLLLAVICSPYSWALAQGNSVAPAQAVAPSIAAIPALTLGDALRLALAHNTELASARLEVQAMEAAEMQAGARPNPELGVLVEDTRNATRTTTVQWAQPIELGGKRTARLTAAARAREQALVALQAKQAGLQAAVTSAFFELLGAQEQALLMQASLDLAHNASTIAGKRLQAGKVPPLELAKAQVAEAGVRAELLQARSELQLTRQRLSIFWGQTTPNFERADGNADALPAIPSDREVGERMAQAAVLKVAQLDVARRQALTGIEQAKRIPDPTVTLGAKRAAELGRTQLVVGISVPLPILDNNQGNLLEALRREDQARETVTTVRLQLQTEVSAALEKLRLTSQQVQLLRGEVLTTAQAAYDAAVKGYALGKFAFLDVLDAQRTLFQLRQQVLRSTADAYRAAADIDRLLGQGTGGVDPLQE